MTPHNPSNHLPTPVYKWLQQNVYDFIPNRFEYSIVDAGKINSTTMVSIHNDIHCFEYPFGVINNDFELFSLYIMDLKGFPLDVKGDISIKLINKNIYSSLWIDLLTSCTPSERNIYIKNYSKKLEFYSLKPIIPKDVINNLKINKLLNEC